MSALPVRSVRRGFLALLSLGGFLFAAGPAFAEPDLTQFAKQNQVAAQKVESQVRSNLAEAKRLEVQNSERALELMRASRELLDGTPGLDSQVRQELLRAIDSRTRSIRATIESLQGKEPERTADTDRTERGRERDTQRPPKGPRPDQVAGDFRNKVRDGIKSGSDLRRMREERYLEHQRDLQVASLPPRGDIDFGDKKRWQMITERRKKYKGPELTEQEKNLLRALNSVLTVNFEKRTFKEVLDYLAEKTSTSIIVDRESMKEVQLEYDDQVDFSTPKVSFKTILRKLLSDRGLTYVLKEGTIQVYTPQKARNILVTRTYPVGDLLPPMDPRFAGTPLGLLQSRQAAQQIINLFMTIEPESWAANGGTGTIMYNAATQSIIIRQSAEFHFSLADKLGR
jgi:hypothetical protein